MDLVTKAIHFAADAFDGAQRKGSGTPAVLHGLEAAQIAATMTSDVNTLAAAILHDVVEDAGVTVSDINTRFGERVAELVAAETENKRRDIPSGDSWLTRKRETIAALRSCDDGEARIICLGDKLSNMRAFYADYLRHGDAIWSRFNQTDPKMHHWYYREIAGILSELSEYPAWREYDRLIRLVFEKYETVEE